MPQIAAWMDEAITRRLKEDEQAIERIAGEVRDLPAGFPMPGWAEAGARTQPAGRDHDSGAASSTETMITMEAGRDHGVPHASWIG